MESTLSRVSSVIWSESFWLPENITWKDLRNDPSGLNAHVRYPEITDFLVTIPITIVLVILRYFFDRMIFRPFGRYFNLHDGIVRLPENVKLLHTYYKKVKRPEYRQTEALAEQLSWDIRRVQRWFRKRRSLDKSSQLRKLCESAWSVVFLVTLSIFAFYVLHDEEFIYNNDYAFIDWPKHDIKDQFYWFYMLALGHWFSLVIYPTTDLRRKDSAQMILHHMVTISLFIYSYTVNFLRLGMLVIIIHDPADYWMNAAKVCKYIGYEKPANILFVIFLLVWYLTRLYMFPLLILRCWSFTEYFCPASIINYVFFIILQLLHVYWTRELMRVAYSAFTKGEVEDLRSESEESEDSECETKTEQNSNNIPMTNGISKKEN